MARKKTPSKAATDENRAMEQRVVAFAEQLGRMAGTVERKTTGWLDMASLSEQVTRIRDGAADLLRHLGTARGDSPHHESQTAESGSSAPPSRDTGDTATKQGPKTRVRKAASPRAAKPAAPGPRVRSREHLGAPGRALRKPPSAAGAPHSNEESVKDDATDRARRTRGK